MQNIKIVEFQSKYAKAVKELVYLVLGHVGIKPDKYPIINKETDIEYIEKIYRDHGRFWLAFRDDILISTVAIEELDSDIAELKRMFVLPEFQGTWWVKKSGLKEILPELLKTRVYVGLSAGSMITAKDLALIQSQI